MVTSSSTGKRQLLAASAVAWLVAAGAAAGAGTPAPSAAPSAGLTTRVTVGVAGAEPDNESFSPAISADGRFVAFTSNATNLVRGDTNLAGDVFVRDRVTRAIRRVSVGPRGAQANGFSLEPAISADGQYVAFWSTATNLVTGDTNGAADVFVRDRSRGVTRRVSLGPGGLEANSSSVDPAISADGRFVAFESTAFNLVADDTDEANDVFVRDRVRRVTERVSVGPGGQEANSDSSIPAISADGRYVTFESRASNLVVGDTNEVPDVFMRDRTARVTERVSVGAGGEEGDSVSSGSSVSRSGRFVAFGSFASNLVVGDTNGVSDVFVRDRSLGVTRQLSVGVRGTQADGGSFDPVVSVGGRYTAFYSQASNLVTGDTNDVLDVFVWDRAAQRMGRVSVASSGRQGNLASAFASITARAGSVAFVSRASNLVAGDTNGFFDIYVRDSFD